MRWSHVISWTKNHNNYVPNLGFLPPCTEPCQRPTEGTKLWFAAKRTKMSIAAPEQKLLRIVFPAYMFFFRSQIQKKYFPGAGVWIFFNECQFVGKRQKIKGRAIKCFLFGLKSWWKGVESVLAYRQKWPISSDETFVSMSPEFN